MDLDPDNPGKLPAAARHPIATAQELQLAVQQAAEHSDDDAGGEEDDEVEQVQPPAPVQNQTEAQAQQVTTAEAQVPAQLQPTQTTLAYPLSNTSQTGSVAAWCNPTMDPNFHDSAHLENRVLDMAWDMITFTTSNDVLDHLTRGYEKDPPDPGIC
jgi:Sec-independent protein translocase protein TatA